MAAKPKVVIIGGGPGGANCAKAAGLAAIADVTLIDTKEYHEATPATLRAFTEPAWIEKCIWRHSDYLKGKAKFVLGSVSRIDDASVQLADGQTIPFDYVVIAAGSSVKSTDKSPASKQITVADRVAWFRAQAECIAAAKSILIIGGGPVGVEFAGEVLTDMPGKKVTIVQSGPALFAGAAPAVPDSYASGAAKWLQANGATLIFNDRCDTGGASGPTPGASYTTGKGVKIDADYVLMAAGALPNTAFYPTKLDEKKLIVVDDTLKVKGTKSHFAIGDCAATGDCNYAFFAKLQGELVAKNIAASIRGKALSAYKRGPDVQFLSLGRRAGRALLPFGEACGCLAVAMKSKDLALGQVRKDFGLSA